VHTHNFHARLSVLFESSKRSDLLGDFCRLVIKEETQGLEVKTNNRDIFFIIDDCLAKLKSQPKKVELNEKEIKNITAKFLMNMYMMCYYSYGLR